ncbi:MAG: sigma-70 family RNA polymerase sigma factor [Planctomycetota bacterium]|jgi:RNA polymerase sigma factor (TIGR02999 family)
MEPRGEVTRLLAELCAGNEKARDKLFPLVYDQLHALAHHYMQRQNPGHTLQATALVHEAYLKLGGEQEGNWESRMHFIRVAARAMRSVLVDHERKKQAHKRGGALQREPLVSAEELIDAPAPSLVELDMALTRLGKIDPQCGQIVELRFFGGLTVEETARALNISARTVKREWRLAKAWLKREMLKENES